MRPTTLAQARKYRYGTWAGNPKGNPFREKDCIQEIIPNERGALPRQCSSRQTSGSPFCAWHKPGAKEARAAKRPPTRFERELAAIDREDRERRYLRRCERALKQIAAALCLCLTSASCPCPHSVAKKALRKVKL